MTAKARIKAALVAGLFSLSAGGLALHYVIHPLEKHAYAFVPLAIGAVSVVVIPWLFCCRKTLHLGYLLNGMAVLLGTITMGHFALVEKPIWPDLLILWPKFLMGYAIFQLEMFKADEDLHLTWKQRLHYPHFGFWLVHLVMLSVVYAAGNLLWR